MGSLLTKNYSDYFSSSNYYAFSQAGAVDAVTSGIYQTLIMIAAFVIVLVIGGISIRTIFGDSKERSESKKRFLTVVSVGCIIFGLAGIIAEIVNIVSNIDFY